MLFVKKTLRLNSTKMISQFQYPGTTKRVKYHEECQGYIETEVAIPWYRGRI